MRQIQFENLNSRAVKTACVAAFAFTMFLGFSEAVAQGGSIAVELNKLEPQAKQCRAYLVVQNKGDTNYTELKLDLVLFQPDGVIGRRFAIELAPLKANKRTVKLFDLEETACNDVGSFLINEVMECEADSGPIADCLERIAPSSLNNVQLSK
jgi:hypothetical protein